MLLPGIQTGLHGDHGRGGARGQPAAGLDGGVRGGAGDGFMAHRMPAQQQRAEASTQTMPVDPYCDAAFDGIYDLDLDPDDRPQVDDDGAAAYDLDPDSDDADERDGVFRDDEEMGDPGDGYAAFGDPFTAPLRHLAVTAEVPGARQHGAGCSAPARLGEHHRPSVCFSMEADCRAAWAALQPDRLPEYSQPAPAQQSGLGEDFRQGWDGCVRGDVGSVAHMGDAGMYGAPGDKMQEDGCFAGGPAGSAAALWTGPPYAPQSTERRRRPRRKWDATVNYERITRRLELRFDAVRETSPRFSLFFLVYHIPTAGASNQLWNVCHLASRSVQTG